MRHYGNRERALAIGLAVLSGFVDALGFLKLGGMFVSFMSGNTTRMAVGATTSVDGSLFAGALIAAFMSGVMAGTAIVGAAGRWRKQAVLAFVCMMLTLACLVEMLFGSVVATLLMASGMGAANTVFQRDGEVSVGVTYMTGTLVKLGQHLTLALSGGAKLAWIPYFSLWIGLVAGGVAGAKAFSILGLQALWIAIGFAALLFVHAVALGPLNEAE